VSKRIKLRHIASLIFPKIIKIIFDGLRLKVYIKRNRRIYSAIYSSRVRDRALFKAFSEIVRELFEESHPADTYNVAVADKIERDIDETSTVNDSYLTEEADRTIKILGEATITNDSLTKSISDRVELPFEEDTEVTESYRLAMASLVILKFIETINAIDAYNIVKATRVVRRYSEIVKPYEASISGFPWEEDKTLWVYYVFEKVLVDDSALYYALVNGRRVGGYINERGVGYDYDGRERGEVTSVSDEINVDVYEQWVRATKYDGHAEAEEIYNLVGTKYDGHVEAEAVYNFVGTKYDGYTESSVTIS